MKLFQTPVGGIVSVHWGQPPWHSTHTDRRTDFNSLLQGLCQVVECASERVWVVASLRSVAALPAPIFLGMTVSTPAPPQCSALMSTGHVYAVPVESEGKTRNRTDLDHASEWICGTCWDGFLYIWQTALVASDLYFNFILRWKGPCVLTFPVQNCEVPPFPEWKRPAVKVQSIMMEDVGLYKKMKLSWSFLSTPRVWEVRVAVVTKHPVCVTPCKLWCLKK